MKRKKQTGKKRLDRITEGTSCSVRLQTVSSLLLLPHLLHPVKKKKKQYKSIIIFLCLQKPSDWNGTNYGNSYGSDFVVPKTKKEIIWLSEWSQSRSNQKPTSISAQMSLHWKRLAELSDYHLSRWSDIFGDSYITSVLDIDIAAHF